MYVCAYGCECMNEFVLAYYTILYTIHHHSKLLPEMRAWTASALILSPRSLKARKMARLAAADMLVMIMMMMMMKASLYAYVYCFRTMMMMMMMLVMMMMVVLTPFPPFGVIAIKRAAVLR